MGPDNFRLVTYPLVSKLEQKLNFTSLHTLLIAASCESLRLLQQFFRHVSCLIIMPNIPLLNGICSIQIFYDTKRCVSKFPYGQKLKKSVFYAAKRYWFIRRWYTQRIFSTFPYPPSLTAAENRLKLSIGLSASINENTRVSRVQLGGMHFCATVI